MLTSIPIKYFVTANFHYSYNVFVDFHISIYIDSIWEEANVGQFIFPEMQQSII